MLRQRDLLNGIVFFRCGLLGNCIALFMSGLLLQIDKALLLFASQLIIIPVAVVIIIVLLAIVIAALLCANLIGNSFCGVLIKFV